MCARRLRDLMVSRHAPNGPTCVGHLLIIMDCGNQVECLGGRFNAAPHVTVRAQDSPLHALVGGGSEVCWSKATRRMRIHICGFMANPAASLVGASMSKVRGLPGWFRPDPIWTSTIGFAAISAGNDVARATRSPEPQRSDNFPYDLPPSRLATNYPEELGGDLPTQSDIHRGPGPTPPSPRRVLHRSAKGMPGLRWPGSCSAAPS